MNYPDTEREDGPSNRSQWVRRKLGRRKPHFLHALSKDIVKRCADRGVGTLVVGDPSGADADNLCRNGNKRLDNWAYTRLMNLIDYKAREWRIEVKMPDERGTSSRCSVCGHEDGDARIERGLWKYSRSERVAQSDIRYFPTDVISGIESPS